MSDFLFGEEGQPARIEDVRTEEQRNLGSQTIQALSDILQQRGDNPLVQQAGGPNVAPITGNEQQILSGIQGQVTGQNPLMQAGSQQLMQQAQGQGMNPMAQALMPETQAQAQNIISGQTQDPASNPALQASIEAAQRPLQQRFEQQMGDARGQFTQAGQFVQPGASSPFETAEARLQTGLANAMGDVSTELVNQNLAREQQRQLQLMGQVGQQFEQGQDRSLQAASQTAPFQTAQLNQLMQGLEAQALPRMIEQQGIEEGTRQFERQQEQLLNALSTAFGETASPQTVTLPGTEGSTGAIGSLLGAAGTAIGGPVGGAIGGAIGGGLSSMFGGGEDSSGQVSVTEGSANVRGGGSASALTTARGL